MLAGGTRHIHDMMACSNDLRMIVGTRMAKVLRQIGKADEMMSIPVVARTRFSAVSKLAAPCSMSIHT